MKLHQLKYAREIVRCDFNISNAATNLHTSQPGISNQIQLLESELGLQIFERHGKRLTGLTTIGHSVIEMASHILQEVDNIHQLASDNNNATNGTLSIGTTHTQARYALPKAIKAFAERYPKVHLNIIQGTPTEVAEMAVNDDVDIAIATEGLSSFNQLAILPCYNWNRSIITLPDHPLTKQKSLTLEDIAKYPILTYVMGFTGRCQQDEAFTNKGLSPDVIFTATDADVIKTYVELGLGIGIIASHAFEPQKDTPLIELDASHLFKPSTTHLGIKRGRYLRQFSYDFIELFAPQLNKSIVSNAIK
jgi:LysR family cys regulon transcriptional activator